MIQKEDITCAMCDSSSAHYKCPSCRTPYCSVKCCQEHKTRGCTPVHQAEEVIEATPERRFPTEDTIPLNQLELLRNSPVIQECLQNPNLRHILDVIDKSNNPTDLIAQAMLEPIFIEFGEECLKVIHSSPGNESLKVGSRS